MTNNNTNSTLERLLAPGPQNVPIHPDDYAALKAFYESTDGDNWNDNDGWDFNNPTVDAAVVNKWYGVTVDTATGRVTNLDLFYNNLRGSIPPELGNLSSLQSLAAQQQPERLNHQNWGI